MPFYECVFIARQDISGTQVEALTDSLAGIISEQGGSVTKREYWGLKNLSFRIKKNRKGHYGLINIDAPAAAVTEMERTMRINEDVLRFLTVRVDELEEGPSSAMQNRGAREDRPRRGFGDNKFGDNKFGGGDKFGGGENKFAGGENKFGDRSGHQGGEG